MITKELKLKIVAAMAEARPMWGGSDAKFAKFLGISGGTRPGDSFEGAAKGDGIFCSLRWGLGLFAFNHIVGAAIECYAGKGSKD